MLSNKKILLNFEELILKKVNFVINYCLQDSVEVEEDFIRFKLSEPGNLKIKTKYSIEFKVPNKTKFLYSNPSPNYIEIINKFDIPIMKWEIHSNLRYGDTVTLQQN